VPSDGKGGRVLSPLRFGQDNGNHFFSIANSNNLQGVDISWNEVVNEPFVSSVGSLIDISSSSGSATGFIDIHDNFLQGGYGADPFAPNYFAGGINLSSQSNDTQLTATAFVRVHDNQIVGHSNYGIGVAAGHDNDVYANRAVSTGRLADGRAVGTPYGNGFYVWNCTCYNQPPTVFYNNSAHDNVAAWLIPDPPSRLDYFLPDCAGGPSGATSKCTNNMSLPDPITIETEAGETALWQQKLRASKIRLGPSS